MLNRTHFAALAGITAIAAGAITVAACGDTTYVQQPSNQYDYVAVCVDHFGTRLPDSYCSNRTVGDSWYYYGSGGNTMAPPIGSRASGGYATLPSTAGKTPSVETGGVPTKGGTVTRGGFGAKTTAAAADKTSSAPADKTTQPKTTKVKLTKTPPAKPTK